MAEPATLVSPFLRRGPARRGMMLGMLACLSVTALHFAGRYDPAFALRYAAGLALAGLIETVYALLQDGRWVWPRASTLVTAALLLLSVPARMPAAEAAAGILVAVSFGKLTVDPRALRLNPMLMGRLFLMLVFADSIQRWAPPAARVDALSTATPLGLFAAEGAVYSPWRIARGAIGGDWNGLYALVPGAPGEVMPLLAAGCGAALYLAGVLDWRPAAAYLAGFAGVCALLGMPVAFHVAAGSTVFTAVYIVTDPRSMPASKFGRWAAGLLAGVSNALLRRQGYYPEGVVWAVLAANLLTPALDRLAFIGRGWRLRRASARAGKRP